MKSPVILVVDDEAETLKYVGANLQIRGYEVLQATTGHQACTLIGTQHIDLVILDLMLPDIDGLSVCEIIRQSSSVPIMMLSAREQEQDIVHALDAGADDYLTKPFGVEELLARVRSILRRVRQSAGDALLVLGDLTIDPQTQRVTIGTCDLHLTRTEYALLEYLAAHAGRVLTHRMLLQTVWGPEYSGETEYLWTYVRRLRRKLRDACATPISIATQPGVGYYLTLS